MALDPNPKFAKAFRRFRPKDKHLTSGVSASPGSLTYFECKSDNLNTLSPERVSELSMEGIKPVHERTVTCEPLSTIVKRELGDTPIDLLNVDVEGMDLEVLQSLGLRKHRPTVMILEDFGRYVSFLTGAAQTPFEQYVRAEGYMPIAQSAWSSIFIAEDWQALFRRSRAFDEARTRNSYLPGQFEKLPWANRETHEQIARN